MKKDLFTYIKQLFQAAEESSPTVPVIHEPLQLTEAEQEDYDTWSDQLIRRRLTDWLHEQYVVYARAPQDTDEAISFLNTPSSKGFVVHFYKTNYSKREVNFFLHYLKAQVQQLNYRVQVSDSRTFNRKDWVETINRHYLKPRLQFEANEQLDQKFGNILIEHQLRNDRPHFLKLSATSYQDRQYKPAEAFNLLLQNILQN